MMHHVPQAGLTVPAVAGPVERVVRRHPSRRLANSKESVQTYSSLLRYQRRQGACHRCLPRWYAWVMIMDARVTELHCIMPIANVASVMSLGILSHEQAAKLPHRSVAMQEMQDRRDQKSVPNGLRLHQYANLYFHARNPMLYKRRHEDVCVLTLSTGVLLIDKAVITDQNAASDYVRFLSPAQWPVLEFEDIFALDWRHPDDPYRYYRHKSRKCAEVLVPRSVPPKEGLQNLESTPMVRGMKLEDDGGHEAIELWL
jgi:hypothetical protein